MCLLLSSCVSQGWGQRCGAYSVGPGLETPNLLGVSRGRGMQVWMLLLGGVLLVSHGATLPLPAPCPLMTAVTLLRTLVPALPPLGVLTLSGTSSKCSAMAAAPWPMGPSAAVSMPLMRDWMLRHAEGSLSPAARKMRAQA